MTTQAKTTFKTKAYYGGAGSPVTGGTLISEVVNHSLPEEVSEAINATSHDSGAAEYIPSELVDGGQVTLEMNYIGSASQLALRGYLGGTAHDFYINLPEAAGAPQLAFSALVTNWAWGEAPAESPAVRRATATLKISGGVTLNTQGA